MIICQKCGKVLNSFKALTTHIQFNHNKKEYYDRYMKKENDGICKICGKPTEFYTIKYGYYKFCSKECQIKDIKKNNEKLDWKIMSKKKEETNLKKYGVRHNMQRKEIMDQVKKTNLKKYGVENVIFNKNISEKAKNKREKTCYNQYGVKSYTQVPEIKEKRKNTCLQKYGVEHVTQSETIKIKMRKTCLEKYGVEYVSQNSEIFRKIESHSYQASFHPCGLYYRGSYEKDFLDLYSNKIEIKQGLSFKYLENERLRVYHSDFFIPSKNLIIEIKNSYLSKRYKDNIELKKMAVINSGHNWIIIINKNYSEFEQFIKAS